MSTSRSVSARIDIRLTRTAKAQIERAASVAGRTLTEFIKDASLQSARKVLAEHEELVLSDRDREIFLRVLDSDPTPNAALLEAARTHRARMG